MTRNGVACYGIADALGHAALHKGINSEEKGDLIMKKYVCDICDYVYDPAEGDPDNGVKPGTAFADLPEDWVCPLCGASKDDFSEMA